MSLSAIGGYMEKIKIVTDSTADLTKELIEEYDIEVVASYRAHRRRVIQGRVPDP